MRLVATFACIFLMADGVSAQAPRPLENIKQVVAGGSVFPSGHSCALTEGGAVKCWGSNLYGKIGDNSTVNHRKFPVQVVGLTSGITAIAAGGNFTCALTTAGGVKCWGQGEHGQLGNGGIANSKVPVDVSGMQTGVQAIFAGQFTACAINSLGGLKCWGRNDDGEVGDGTLVNRTTPVEVSGLSSGVVAGAGGHSHTCAVTSLGQAKCWGSNSNGELGDGTRTFRRTPVDVVGLGAPAISISAGGSHTCAITVGGGSKCWGYNESGQLGNGNSNYSRPELTPVSVVGLEDGTFSIDTAGYATCAINDGSTVQCWGANSYFLVSPATGSFPTPRSIQGLQQDALEISIGEYHGCALTSGKRAKCWGENSRGSLGDGTAYSSGIAGFVIEQPQAWLYIRVDRISSPQPGYEVTVLNIGSQTAPDVRARITAPTGIVNSNWTCAAPSSCSPAGGSGDIDTTFSLASDTLASIRIFGTVGAETAFVEINPTASSAVAGGILNRVMVNFPENDIGILKSGFD